jgi:AmmeMemoRadiSam system protein B/AmmeMemoRadiSam system protein A
VVAAAAYRHVQRAAPERVFILGFAHRGARPGVTGPDVDVIETPLGAVAVDRETVAKLASVREECDHSVEIQLPLLQRAAAGARIVPLYVGPMEDGERREAGRRLADVLQPGDVVLASSDLTHYGKDFGYVPFAPDARALRELDMRCVEAAGSLDARLFLDTIAAEQATVCGTWPVGLWLETLAALGAEDVFQQTLDYQTSAEVAGDERHSVSYGALGYYRAAAFGVSQVQERVLLGSARSTLEEWRRSGKRKAAKAEGEWQRAAVFVSLHAHGELLGCLGDMSKRLPLGESVPQMALAAALDDPRFHRRELPEGYDIEISILTPLKRIREAGRFVAGRDGALLEYEHARGLLLPQVGRESGWTAERFLETLGRKAGLWPGAYREKQARLSVFQAQVCSE